jgi:hypothetical protein
MKRVVLRVTFGIFTGLFVALSVLVLLFSGLFLTIPELFDSSDSSEMLLALALVTISLMSGASGGYFAARKLTPRMILVALAMMVFCTGGWYIGITNAIETGVAKTEQCAEMVRTGEVRPPCNFAGEDFSIVFLNGFFWAIIAAALPFAANVLLLNLTRSKTPGQVDEPVEQEETTTTPGRARPNAGRSSNEASANPSTFQPSLAGSWRSDRLCSLTLSFY